MAKDTVSVHYKNYNKTILIMIVVSTLVLLVSFTSRLYMPDDRKKMTYNWGVQQKLSISTFNFQKYQYNSDSKSVSVAVSQTKSSYIDESGKEQYKQEQYKFYTLVDGKYFSDVNVKTYDSTFKYNYILSVPLPEKFYTFYIVVERYENNNKTGDGIYSSIDYRDIQKDNGDVQNIEKFQESILKSDKAINKKQLDYDLNEMKDKNSEEYKKNKVKLKKEIDQLVKEKAEVVKKVSLL